VRLLTILAALGLASVAAAQPRGWQIVKDKTGVCQMAVPPDWHINAQIPNMATAPDLSAVMISAQAGKEVRPIPEGAQPVLGVEKMIENTQKRVFWAGKPVAYPPSSPPVIAYHVTTPGKGGTCVGQITVKVGTPDTLVKQLADTVGAAK
jgi:hypothetical protein